MELMQHLSNSKCDMCLITETWLRDGDADIWSGECDFIGANRSNHIGGGIGIISRKDRNIKLVAKEFESFEKAEYMFNSVHP